MPPSNPEHAESVDPTKGRFESLQIPISLAPSIFIDDIGQRNTADLPEPTYRIADPLP